MAAGVVTPPVTPASAPMWRVEGPSHNEANSSGVSWPAVLAGAFVAAAIALILLALGTGLGFESVSPWAGQGASSSAIGKSAIVWLILMQIIAASMGGYIAGRLRTKWASIHTDEVYFRDTAHGLLVWAVGLVITAAFLASAASAMLGNVASNATSRGAFGTSEMSGAAGRSRDSNAYFIDTMLRRNAGTSSALASSPSNSAAPNSEPGNASLRNEAGLIFANDLREGSLPATDKTYLGQAVAARTGISESDAEQRVSDAFAQIQQAADTARKTLAHTSLWIFLALLIGAFCASLAATWGGAQRDNVVVIDHGNVR